MKTKEITDYTIKAVNKTLQNTLSKNKWIKVTVADQQTNIHIGKLITPEVTVISTAMPENTYNRLAKKRYNELYNESIEELGNLTSFIKETYSEK